jgi:uncharacterized protein YxjI
MPSNEQFTIRKKVFKLFGGAFHIRDGQGRLVGYCRQKAFRLREDLRIYTDESCSETLLLISTRNIIDFGATYEIKLPDGTSLGTIRRKGLASTFVRDQWLVFDPDGRQVGELLEDGQGLALARRWIPLVSLISPQAYVLKELDAEPPIARFRTHFNLVVRRIGIRIERTHPRMDERLVLGIGCLLSAFENRDER